MTSLVSTRFVPIGTDLVPLPVQFFFNVVMSAKRQKIAPYTVDLEKVKILADLCHILEDWPDDPFDNLSSIYRDLIRKAHARMPGKNIKNIYREAILYYPEINYVMPPITMSDFLRTLATIVDRELRCVEHELYGGLASSALREAVLHIHAKLGGVAPRLEDLVVFARRRETIFECTLPRWLRDDGLFSMAMHTGNNPANSAFFFADLEEFVKTGAGNASFKRDYIFVKFWNYSCNHGVSISMAPGWTPHSNCESYFYNAHAHLTHNWRQLTKPSVSVVLSMRIREENTKYKEAHPNTRELTPFYRDLYVRERRQFIAWYFGKALGVHSTNVLHTLFHLCPAL